MRERPKIRLTVLPMDRPITSEAGSSLLEALRQAGIEIVAPCDGQGLCGKCKVHITGAAPMVETPHPHLRLEEISAGTRLACEAAVQEGMVVTLPADHTLDIRILEGERIRKNRLAPPAVVEQVNGQFRLCYQGRPSVSLSSWREAFSPKGIAVDLGTTTLVVTLMDLLSGSELATTSAVNPQSRFGQDVMTRIQHASTPAGLRKLGDVIAAGVNELIGNVCREAKTHPHEILDAVIGGNTTMLQLSAVIDPAPLGRAPFTVSLESGCSQSAVQYRLNINPQARVYIPPVVHAFVGSDISAGLLSIDFFNQEAPTLFIDMGTNGELALTADGKQIVTSTAVGPAFEAMGITHGMRASSGAIETAWTNDQFLSVRTIDGKPAEGICGSGIIDIMACLIRLEAVESGGRLKNPQMDRVKAGPFLDRHEMLDGVAAVKLAENVYFTQKDIRKFQLAKSAVQTGIDLLLSAANVNYDQLKKIVIAGAFGHHLREESLRQIGLIHQDFNGQIAFAGNTCRTGCVLMLIDGVTREYIQEKMQQVVHLSIADAPDFQSRFIKNLQLGG